MDEHELDPEEPDPWTVDELRPRSLQPVDGCDKVSGRERDVVHPRSPTGDEAADGRIVTSRRHELDATLADEQRCGLDPLLGERLAVLETCSEERLVRRDRLVEIGDGDPEMMDAPHAGDAIRER